MTFIYFFSFLDRMDIPVEEMENLKLLLKQCDLESILAKVEKIEKEFHFYGKYLRYQILVTYLLISVIYVDMFA